MTMLGRWLPFVLLFPAGNAPAAEVSVPSFFSDHMVLQRDMPVAIWGWAADGEEVSVSLGDRPAVKTTAKDGAWKVRLPASSAGGPFTLTVKGRNEIRINDVMVGEVWLCSGQSNMEMTVASSNDFPREKAAATDSLIRQLLVPKRPLSQPDPNLNAKWTVCSPDTVGGFTACGYFMARLLRQELKVPVGLLHSSWGGTRIEPWTPPAGFAQVPACKDISQMLEKLDPASPANRQRFSEHLDRVEAWVKKTRAALSSGGAVEPMPTLPLDAQPLAERKDPQQQPTTLYNGMIHALAGYGMRGAIWYQGESNHGEGLLYAEKKKALIGGWRKIWGIGDFPFNFVQIAPFRYGTEDPEVLARFWVAQNACTAIPNAGQAVITDVGDIDDIHPRNKQEVGRRLALIALNRTYGRKDLECSGPVFKSMTVEGNRIRVRFDHASGLKSRDGKPLTWFEVLGEETEWVKAEAAIDGETVLVSSPQVARPVSVRFAWHKLAQPNLANGAGLPAATFTAGGGAPYVDSLPLIPEAKEYELVYELDLERLGGSIPYEKDNSATVKNFDRVAYLLELKAEGRPVRYVWASMDAFTNDARKIGIPAADTNASFQKKVSRLTVVTNVKDLAAGTFAEGGNIEFWPNNYGPGNGAHISGASDSVYDFGDQPAEPRDGYGCMQVHNPGARQTVFALNNWKAGGRADLGIGNSPGDNRDWTFSGNAGAYAVKKLRVFVRPGK
jgi:sialate O-acetylesterase